MVSTRTQSSGRRRAGGDTQTVAWQGWSLTVPADWNPVKVDGDFGEGALLLADLHSPRLGLRWKRAGRRLDPAAWAAKAMTGEVGKLAAAEAVDFALSDAAGWAVSRLYQDPAPPGRDVWVGQSVVSGRVLEIVHHVSSRGRAFAESILPGLADTPADAATVWSIFDLRLATPPGVSVRWYRFNAGDLALGLDGPDGKLTIVRQVGPATLALARQPLAGWVTQLQAATRKLYRPITRTEPATLDSDGRTLVGVRGTLHRKRRLWWARMIAREQTVLAFHDTERDRLRIGQSADEAFLRTILATLGRSSPAEAD